MKTAIGLQITGKTLYILGVLIIILSPVIFRRVVVPLVGWEAIVGTSNVKYNADHTRIEAFTNPGAIIGCLVWIGVVGYAILFVGKKMQRYGAHSTSRTQMH